uniref:Uncharacterized protein n=1 Tax=viral metagenome TaxID=1070528 RepID=A0A6C0KFF8_9ZZZZ
MLILITELLLDVTLGTITFILKNTARGIVYIYSICSIDNRYNRDDTTNNIVYRENHIPYENNNINHNNTNNTNQYDNNNTSQYDNNNTNTNTSQYDNIDHDFEIIDIHIPRN